MSESFDDMMRREFGDDFGEMPEMGGELLELYQRYGLPPEAAMLVHEQVIDALLPIARLRTMADRFEAEGVTRVGFRRELEALIIRQLTLLSQS
jgi:hypothetical protein